MGESGPFIEWGYDLSAFRVGVGLYRNKWYLSLTLDIAFVWVEIGYRRRR